MPFTNTSTQQPTHYLILLYHGHQLLDSAGPLDILSTITKHPSGLGANLTLTLASETLDPVNLAPVPPPTAPWTFETPAELARADGGTGVRGGGFNLTMQPDVTFSAALQSLRDKGGVEVRNAYGQLELRPVDVLFIPGGIGSRMMRVDKSSGEKTLNVASAVEFARSICLGGFVRTAVMTVCTGSDLFARTGLLKGRRACTNFAAHEAVAGRHGDVRFLRARRWVRSLPGEISSKSKGEVENAGRDGGDTGENGVRGLREVFDKEVWTSAGISAGMDLMLWFACEVYGREFARGIGRRLEYEWREGVGEGEVDPYYT